MRRRRLPPEKPEIDRLENAVLVAGLETEADPPADGAEDDVGQLTRIGVRTAEGEISRFGTDAFRHRYSEPVELADLPAPPDDRPGTAIYGGVLGPQFGHAVTQSVGRLWTAAEDPQAPLAFLPVVPSLTRIPDWFTDLTRLLGVTNPLWLVPRSTRVERLIIGPEHCNLERRPRATKWFVAWLRENRPQVEINPGLSVYVSRSGLAPELGQFLHERLIEDALQAEGYRIVHPEALSMAEQADIYGRAARLLFADGSAIHLWSLFGTPAQKVGMILRRPIYKHMPGWFHRLLLPQPATFDAAVAEFQIRARSVTRHAAVLDLRTLWDQLRAAGFHGSTQPLGPPREAMLDWVEAMRGGADPTDSAPLPLDPVSRALIAVRPLLAPRGL